MNLFSVPPDRPFLDVIAARWLAEGGADPLAVADGLILLPTRRAARALAEAFLRRTGGRPLLLPRIAALGALDEAPLALDGYDIPPAVEASQRLAVLARMVMQLDGRYGAPSTADRAWPLAAELARLIDEATRAEIDLPAQLRGAAHEDYAEHWQRTIAFLEIVTRRWPEWLAEEGLSDIAARQMMLLDGYAKAWRERPPECRVMAAGFTRISPAVARLLGVAAKLPRGQVVLPGLDCALDEAAWDGLDDTHPQAGMRRLLTLVGARRGDVEEWTDRVPAAPGRAALLRRALLPAAALDDWRRPGEASTAGLSLLEPADQQEEAVAIALVLRGVLERDGERAALVTPDRDLAGRVAAELLRHGVVTDDSAGEPLAETPPAVFLRLLAHAVAEDLAPVPLLSLLKHPLAAAGLAPAACREAARGLELACLRGTRPPPGLAGLRRALPDRPEAKPAAALLDRLARCLGPLLTIAGAARTRPVAALAALLEAAEALAASDAEPGAERLWRGEEGNALAAHLAGLQVALEIMPPQPPGILPGLLDSLLAEADPVRSRRALRGRDPETTEEHPRVLIWGLLEAQLQSADCVVLGGLVEGVWPQASDPGPWMSRPMRAAVGLPSPEEVVGQAAHDFVATACAAKEAVLCRPRRRDGAPAVPARWLTRLGAFLHGQGASLPRHEAGLWAAALDHPAEGPSPVQPPRPCPPVAKRPRRLSVTEIETWLHDPYSIYARHVLRLRALHPLDEPADDADYGSIVHDGLHAFLRETGVAWPPDARERLRAAMEAALARAGLRPALAAWWRPRLVRIADWVAAEEERRRERAPPVLIRPEQPGEWQIEGRAGPFLLRGRADRIERHADGRLALLDYKTGSVPEQPSVEKGLAPQLPLEAAMAAAGAFGPELAGEAAELTYWKLSGGFEAGEEQRLFSDDPAKITAVTEQAREGLRALIALYDTDGRAYLSQPYPGAKPRFSDYRQLARVAEWAAVTEEE